MANQLHFFSILQKLRMLPFISFYILLSFLVCDISLASPQLVGSWEVYKDDDRVDGTVPKEIMSFWSNGKFLISGDHPHKGLYRIRGNYLEFLINVGNRAMQAKRQFELNDEELKFKNEKTGWVYYKRISKKPLGDEPDL